MAESTGRCEADANCPVCSPGTVRAFTGEIGAGSVVVVDIVAQFGPRFGKSAIGTGDEWTQTGRTPMPGRRTGRDSTKTGRKGTAERIFRANWR
jgi:hypothetical protein